MSMAASCHLFVMPLLGVAALLACVRLLRGETLADRVVALDLLATIAIAFAITEAIASGRALYLDVALFLALVAFLGTVALALHVQRSSS